MKIGFLSYLKSRRVAIQATNARSDIPQIEPVEPLEQRLCLGSMHSGLAAGWGHDHTPTQPAEIRIVDELKMQLRLDEEPEYSAPTASENSNQSSLPAIRISRMEPALTGPQQNPPAPVVSLLGDELMSSTQTRANLSTALQTRLADVLHRLTVVDHVLPIFNQTRETVGTQPVAIDRESTFTPSSNQIRPETDQVTSQPSRHQHSPLKSADLAAVGLELDGQGNAIGMNMTTIAQEAGYDAWWSSTDQPVKIYYDFRDINDSANQITEQQKQVAVQALEAWSVATNRQIVFEQNVTAPENRIINIGVGDLSAVGHVSGAGALLGLGGGQVTVNDEGSRANPVTNGIVWLDQAETWDNVIGNGNPSGTFDFSTVVAHEIGHAIGFGDQYVSPDNAMDGTYSHERNFDSIKVAIERGYFNRTFVDPAVADAIELQPMTTGLPQLQQSEVQQLLKRAAAVSGSEDAIIAVVDRNGRILGVRVEAKVLAAISNMNTLVFAIDGAVAKARTAAMFSNGDRNNGTATPLTSRTVQFLSQSTITQREVEANPNVDNGSLAQANASTRRGPGFVAPIGVGGHFPPEVNFTPLVDLFGIEHTNRDSMLHPGADGIKGTADDLKLDERFNSDSSFVRAGQELHAPESYGAEQNSNKLPSAQSRGIATLPGGIPLFRDTDGDGGGDTLVGGIGVFFPGADGYATHEQGFIPGIGQTTAERINASRVLEAEYIAFVAAGGSLSAQQAGFVGAKFGTINGVAGVADLDLPSGRLDLVGIQLDVYGPSGSRLGLESLLDFGKTLPASDLTSGNSGADQVVDGTSGALYRDGESVPTGWLVEAHDSADGSITKANVEQIIQNGITAAELTRAAIRLPISNPTRMVFAVTDTNGEVLGLYRMQDATTFSIDVAVAKARNVAYYADANDVQQVDQIGDKGVAFTNRTFRFLAQPRFPSGINGTDPAPFSILHDGNINQLTGENNGAPAPVSAFSDIAQDTTPSIFGHDSFFPNTNFRDPGDGLNPTGSDDTYHKKLNTIANQNGIVFFPGSTPLYKGGKLVGGFGVSGDGVDQDDVVTYVGATGFLPESHGVTRADQTFARNIRLPYQKFLRNPFGGFC